jgi:hypothetical protein
MPRKKILILGGAVLMALSIVGVGDSPVVVGGPICVVGADDVACAAPSDEESWRRDRSNQFPPIVGCCV